MKDYQTPKKPQYKPGLSGLSSRIGSFLELNYEELNFRKETTKKGSIGYMANFEGDSLISLFVYSNSEQEVMVDIFWKESNPSTRQIVIKVPVNNSNDYNNTMDFIGAIFPVFLDSTLEHAAINDAEMMEAMQEAITVCSLFGADINMEGDRGYEDEETDSDYGEMEYHEVKMSQQEIRDALDAALDAGDKEEFERLRAMLENQSFLKHLKGFGDIL